MDVVSRAIKNAILFLGFLQLVTVAYIYGFRRFTVWVVVATIAKLTWMYCSRASRSGRHFNTLDA